MQDSNNTQIVSDMAMRILNRVQGNPETPPAQPTPPVQSTPAPPEPVVPDEGMLIRFDVGAPETPAATPAQEATPAPQAPAQEATPAQQAPPTAEPTGEGDNYENYLQQDMQVPAKPGRYTAMREKFGELIGAHKELKKAAREAQEKLAAYESGEKMPSDYEELRERVTYLEKFERIHDMKNSRQYQETRLKPLNESIDSLTTLVKEYRGDDALVQRILKAPDRPTRNGILSRIFDPVAAQEASALVGKIHSLQQQMAQDEASPGEAMQQLEAEFAATETERVASARARTAQMAQSSWDKALRDGRSKGFGDLTYREGDTTHNENVVKPLVTKAGQEYNKVMTALLELGLNEVPEELASMLASNLVIGYAGAAAIQRNTHLVAEVTALREANRTGRRLQSPSLTSPADIAVTPPSHADASKPRPYTDRTGDRSKDTQRTAMDILDRVRSAK